MLELAPVSASVATAADSVLLPDGRLVAAAVSRSEEYRVCHRFDGEPSGVEQLARLVETEWERAGVSSARERTYLAYEGSYYAMAIGILDRIPVNSLPDEPQADLWSRAER